MSASYEGEYDGTEADWMEDHEQGVEIDGEHERSGHIERPIGSHYRGGDKVQPDRWRCLATGCNPKLDADTAPIHHDATSHRVAKWPVRSADGKSRARVRNKSGYYNKYNVGAKSLEARLGDGS